MAIEIVGEDGQQLRIAVPHFRAFLQHILSYVTQNRPAWDTRAVNSDHKSLMQAELGNQILDYYMDDSYINLERIMKRAVEHGLVLSCGWVKACWDSFLGDELIGDRASGQLYYKGDIRYSNPTIFDVAFDLLVPNYQDLQWVIVRHRENRWDYAARYPAQRDAILRKRRSGTPTDAEDILVDLAPTFQKTDLIDVFTFYHKKTPALPEGREVVFLDAKTWLFDSLSEGKPYYYRGLPVYQVLPGEMLGTILGETPAFHMQGCQEAFDAETSMMISTTNATGPGVIATPEGSITGAKIEPQKGLRILEYTGDKPPTLLDLEKSPEKRVAVAQFFHQQMQLLSGINSSALGQPDANIRAGASMALMEQKALQFSSPVVASWYQLMSEVGTATLHLLKTFIVGGNKKLITVVGLNNRRNIKWFSGEGLSNIDRVVVQPGDPMMRLASGKAERAQDLLKAGIVKTVEEYNTVVKTGQLKPLTETIDAQLDIIHDENDLFRQGLPVPDPMPEDYHALHIPKHTAVINSVDARLDFNLVNSVQAHMQRHFELAMQPAVQMMQMAIGWPNSVPVMPGAGGESKPGLPPGLMPAGGMAEEGGEKGAKPVPQPGGTELTQGAKGPRLQMAGKTEGED